LHVGAVAGGGVCHTGTHGDSCGAGTHQSATNWTAVGIAGPYDAFVGYDGRYGREFLQEEDPDLWKLFYGCIGENPHLKVRLLHSETHSTISYDNSVAFEATLAEAGYDVKLIPFRGGHVVPRELTVEAVMDALKD
jgi:hypothetical protein